MVGPDFRSLLKWSYRYAVAVALSSVSFLGKVIIEQHSSGSVPIGLAAVSLSAWYGGVGPGLLSAFIVSLIRLYCFILPNDSFAISSLGDAIQFFSYLVVALAVGTLTGRLQEARTEAVTRAKEKENFFANISHEIRTPLNAITGVTRLLLETPMDERQREYTRTIQSSTSALTRLMNDLLDLVRMNAGEMKIVPEAFEAIGAFQDAVGLVSQKAALNRVRIAFFPDASLAERIRADQGRITQVVANLLDNAVKFSPLGSTVVLNACLDRDSRRIHCSVEDNGSGIPQELHERIFEPFFQADSSASSRFEGSGLGLSICRRLIHLMGGELSLESELGSGTTFRFQLPYERPVSNELGKAEPGRPTRPAKAPELASPSKKGRILIVEDNDVNQMIACRMIESLGFEPVSVWSGKEAVAAWRAGDYVAILMDCRMPGMDGYQTTREIRNQEESSSISRTPIIAMTAYDTPEAKLACSQSGMDDFVCKPVERQKLAQVLMQWSDQASSVAYLEELRRIQNEGCDQWIRDLVRTYIDRAPARTDAICRAIAEGSRELAAREAHALKSSSASVGARKIMELCGQIEAAVDSGEIERAEVLARALPQAFESFHQDLRDHSWV